MKAHIFPGQGSQFPGMAKDIYHFSSTSKKMFKKANEILEFDLTKIMFGEDAEALKKTNVTQPAIFLHSIVLSKLLNNNFQPDIVAGHSLGEFSALVAAQYINFEDGLRLVSKRASCMQKACEIEPSTMAAVLGVEDSIVEEICSNINEVVVPANYNCTGQLVISGSIKGIEIACKKLELAGAKRVIKLPVGGAFHSPMMDPAKKELEEAINNTSFQKGICPIYQNCTGNSVSQTNEIKNNLIKQLTSPVLWTQTMQNMISKGVTKITEVGPGKVLQNLFRKMNREIEIQSASIK